MAICEFCSRTLFTTEWKAGKDARRQHRSPEQWRLSIGAACMICTLLFEQFKTAVQEAQRVTKVKADLKQDARTKGFAKETKTALYKQDEHVRSTSVEDSLLEWFEGVEKTEDITSQLPVYQVTIQEAGDDAVWHLNFQPIASIPSGTPNLPKQRFIVYAAKFDGQPQQRADQAPKTDNYAQIKKWISDCQTDKHPLCKKLSQRLPFRKWVPTRLIDVGSEGIDPKVVETHNKNIAGADYDKYVTLSYCWGYEPDFLLNEKTLDEFTTSGMKLDKMPQTFKDAITATRALGVKYLWIDAICMLQQDTEEFLREAPTMRDVYGNSYLSLAAVSANNYQQGLFRQRTAGSAPPCKTMVRWGRRPVECIVIRTDFWRGEVLAAPLYSRGWVLQERMLAPRILHCQRRQLVWQCPSLTACEAVPEGLSTIIDDERKDELRWRGLFHRGERALTALERSDLQEIWRQAVTSYTGCNLTKNRDKLMAIAGIAGKMQDMGLTGEHEQYYAGLWEDHFAEQLAWRVTEYRPARDALSYRAPSWSWASADGVVTTPIRIDEPRDYTMKMMGSDGPQMQWANPAAKTGSVLFGSLTAEVELFKPLKFRGSKEPLKWVWTGDKHESCYLHLDQPAKPADIKDRDGKLRGSDDNGECFLECPAAMMVYRKNIRSNERNGFALALKAVGPSHTLMFCRVGLIELTMMGSQAWDTLQAAKDVDVVVEGEVAPSDDRAKDKHIITLL